MAFYRQNYKSPGADSGIGKENVDNAFSLAESDFNDCLGPIAIVEDNNKCAKHQESQNESEVGEDETEPFVLIRESASARRINHKVKEESKCKKPEQVSSKLRQKRLLEEAPLSSTKIGNLCQFSCPRCKVTHSSFNYFYQSHDPKCSFKIKVKFWEQCAIKITAHKCGICSKILPCDSKFIVKHARKHSITTTKEYLQKTGFATEQRMSETKKEYFKRKAEKVPSKQEQKRLLEEAPLSSTKIGNLCQFSCPQCKATRSSFNNFHKMHDPKCSYKIRYRFWEECAGKIIAHKCGICFKMLPCDMKFILEHARRHNLSSTNEYLQKTGFVKEERMLRPRPKKKEQRTKKEDVKSLKKSDTKRSWLDHFPISETFNNESCKFSCPECSKCFNYWYKFKLHMKIQHGKLIKASEIKLFLSKATVVVCKICSEKVLCELRLMAQHLQNHNIKMSEYKLRFQVGQECNLKKKKLLEEAKLSARRIGNLCQFACPQCNTTFNSIHNMWVWHNRNKSNCSYKVRYSTWEECATHVVKHICLICDKTLLCDNEPMKVHMKNHNIKTLREYAEKTGCML